MIPPNLKNEIYRAPATSKNKLVLTWDVCQRTYTTQALGKKPKNMVKNLDQEDIDLVLNNLKKSPFYNPEMKNCKSYLKVTGLLLLVISISLMTTLICLVAPGDMKLETFLIFGVSSLFMIIAVLLVLGWFFLLADEDAMVNREIEFKQIVEELNLKRFVAKNILWKCGRYGAYLVAQNVTLGKGEFDEEERVMPSFDDVYDDGKVYYYVQITDSPYCGPRSKYDPVNRVRDGYYKFFKRFKKMKAGPI